MSFFLENFFLKGNVFYKAPLLADYYFNKAQESSKKSFTLMKKEGFLSPSSFLFSAKARLFYCVDLIVNIAFALFSVFPRIWGLYRLAFFWDKAVLEKFTESTFHHIERIAVDSMGVLFPSIPFHYPTSYRTVRVFFSSYNTAVNGLSVFSILSFLV